MLSSFIALVLLQVSLSFWIQLNVLCRMIVQTLKVFLAVASLVLSTPNTTLPAF